MLQSDSGSRPARLRVAAVAAILLSVMAVAHDRAASSPKSRSPSFDGERAFSYLRAQCAFGPRVPGSKAHRSALEYLSAFFRERGARVVEQRFVVAAGDSSVSAVNLIAGFPPRTGPKLALCAHYDSRPWADADPDTLRRDEPVPGANDGASGVAVLMEVANALAVRTPICTVDIVLFDAEDMGGRGDLDFALGSKYYASQLDRPPAAAILVDMVGDADLDLPVERYSQEMAPSLSAAVWGAARMAGIAQFRSDPHKYVYDDHIPLLLAGVPTVDIIDIEYKHWHTTQDTPDKCSAESLGAVGALLIHLLYNAKSPLVSELK